jgi:hypothetical protein
VFELQIREQQIFLALNVILKATPARWWASLKEGIEDRKQCKILMKVRFGTEVEYIAQRYAGVSDPTDDIVQCREIWSSTPKEEWTHNFIHTLDMIPKNRYLELEMHKETTNWDELTQRFKIKFTFENELPLIDVAFQAIRNNIFSGQGPMDVVHVCSAHRASMIVHEILEHYNVGKEDQDEEHPRNIQIPENEGEHVVEGPELGSVACAQPSRMHKDNIGTKVNMKFV